MYIREIGVVVCETYYQDLEKICDIWEKVGKRLTVDELVNDSIDMFITSFYENNKRLKNERISKKELHRKWFDAVRELEYKQKMSKPE